MSLKKYTTKDIAKLADVSRGTVDRVLHRRGKVSEEAEKKVRKVLEEIDYQPNVIARTLRENKIIQIATLLPSPEIDSFWKKPMIGINEALHSYNTFGVSITQYFYDQNDKSNFEEVAKRLIDSKPDGILTAPLFKKEALVFFDQCHTLGLPYTTINTDISESQYACFIGQDLYQSGRIAADLMFKTQKKSGKILIFHFDEEISNSPHMQEKERGFKDYFAKHDTNNQTFETFNLIDAIEHNLKSILDNSLKNENISGIFVTTSKTFEVAKYLRPTLKTFPLIGYDLVDENIKNLKSGKIDFLINQNPKKQAFQGIHYLTELLVFKKEIPTKELLPIDIITKENISTYL
ncbi:LacI family DNA-binding transcriptional regulator [Reichenbachiella sp. MALMAid0571]|uniref:LacI family DNA-binding transcriptional regulator n=1 Tax=Reichenbachiella sp. MALMAid0571 TaxID=3143939 RepID=UPI0032DE510F